MKFTTKSGTQYVLDNIEATDWGYTATIERVSDVELVSFADGKPIGNLPAGDVFFQHLPTLGVSFRYQAAYPFGGCSSTPVTEIFEESEQVA